MAEAVEVSSPHEELSRAGPSSEELELEAEERRQEEERKRNTDLPIVFKDIDGAVEFEKLSKALERVELTAEERQCVDELQQYLVHGEGSWVLGDDFLAFMGRLLNDESLGVEVRVCTMRCLASAALHDDVSLVLHQDRRHHALLSYANRIDLLDIEEQRALALFMCNLFENLSSSEWLLYISSWESDGKSFSNIRVTTKVCVHATLSSDAELREAGTALMYNFATREIYPVRKKKRSMLPNRYRKVPPELKGIVSSRSLLDKVTWKVHPDVKVFDEVCVELAMALLQLLQYAPIEEHLYRACKSLARLAHHSQQVPQLVLMVGPDPTAFRGTSPRVDEQIDLIVEKIK